MNIRLDNSQERLTSPVPFGESLVQTFAPLTMQLIGHELPDAMIAVDRKGLICAWNAKAAALFGYPADTIMGKSLFTFFPQLHSVRSHVWKELVQKKSIEALTLELSHKDGRKLLIEFSVSLWLDGDNEICGAISLCRDRTPRKLPSLTEMGLYGEQQHLTVILEKMQDAIMCTDASHRIIYVNPAWEDLYGYSMLEVQGQSANLLRSNKTARTVFVEMNQTISQGQMFWGEIWNRRKDGSQYKGDLSIFPIVREDGEISGFLSVMRNMSAEKMLLRAQEQFVADISHELRTPLTNIKFYLSLLEKGRKERHAVYLSTLKREADRLHYMIEGLLDLSLMDQGYADFRFDALDLNAILNTFTEQYMSIARGKEITFTFVPAENLPRVWGDSKYLEQVVFHLLENAIRYTPEGGSVLVSTFVCEEEPLGAKCSDQNKAERAGCICFSVQDTGLGIPNNEHGHIFDRFYRGRNARQLTLPGTGLGLSICKEIILRHDGTLDVSSQVGRGSTFTVGLKPAAMKR